MAGSSVTVGDLVDPTVGVATLGDENGVALRDDLELAGFRLGRLGLGGNLGLLSLEKLYREECNEYARRV